MLKNCKQFKYRGVKFFITENNLDFVPGIRIRFDGINCISIFKDLPERQRQLEIHRLIKDRGLRNIVDRRRKNGFVEQLV